MSYLKVSYLGFEQCCEDFIRGIGLLEQCLVAEAQVCFRQALDSVSELHPLYSKYQSYYGLVQILCGEVSAISECRKAALIDPFDGDICMNLVRAELFLSNRLNALRYVEMGLKFSAEHTGLQQLRSNMGVRRRNPLPLLARDNVLNRLLGRCLRRKKNNG